MEIREPRFAKRKMEGLNFGIVPAENVSKYDGQDPDAINGAQTMQPWKIRLGPRMVVRDSEEVRRCKFIEFLKD